MELSNLKLYRPIRVITAAGASDYAGIPTVGALRDYIRQMAVKHGWARIEVAVGRDYYRAEIKTTSDSALFESDLSQCARVAIIVAESPDLRPTVSLWRNLPISGRLSNLLLLLSRMTNRILSRMTNRMT